MDFNWLNLVFDLISEFKRCNFTLVILPSCGFAGFNRLTSTMEGKLSFGSLIVMNPLACVKTSTLFSRPGS